MITKKMLQESLIRGMEMHVPGDGWCEFQMMKDVTEARFISPEFPPPSLIYDFSCKWHKRIVIAHDASTAFLDKRTVEDFHATMYRKIEDDLKRILYDMEYGTREDTMESIRHLIKEVTS